LATIETAGDLDFEIAHHLAIKEVLKNGVIVGCVFHLLQAVYNWQYNTAKFSPTIWIKSKIPVKFEIDVTNNSSEIVVFFIRIVMKKQKSLSAPNQIRIEDLLGDNFMKVQKKGRK